MNAIRKAIEMQRDIGSDYSDKVADELEAMLKQEPVAWRVMVRRADTEWRQYALYETEKAAKNTLKKIEGDPLQVAAQPLYADRRPPCDLKALVKAGAEAAILNWRKDDLTFPFPCISEQKIDAIIAKHTGGK